MIIGVIAVLVVQAAVMDEVDVVAVLHAGMLFARVTMRMRLARYARDKFLGFGVGIGDFKSVFIDMSGVRTVKVAVVEIIDMAGVIDRLMTTALGVGVGLMPGVEHLMRKRRGGKEG